jgi:perosamine synthetase
MGEVRTALPKRPVPIYAPELGARERELLLEAFDSGWISGRGAFIDRFEIDFAATVGAKHAIAVFNGTVALHVALAAAGVTAGDDVVLPAYTYVACANSIVHTGARPVFADALSQTLQFDPIHLLAQITPRTKAVMIPHLFGHASELSDLSQILTSRGITLIEDCSEALGASMSGRHVGSSGAFATYSFFGNKTITTGEGGMVTTNDDDLASLVRRLRNQGISPVDQYFHDLVAFNYRMTNLQAAIGVAQLERLGSTLDRKQAIADLYRAQLEGPSLRFLGDPEGGRSSQWLVTAVLRPGIERQGVLNTCREHGVDLRPGFVPMYRLPMYSQSKSDFPQTESFHPSVICLPSYPALTTEDLDHVISVLKRAV